MLLAQLAVGDWIGLVMLTLSILGGLVHLVRKATRVEETVSHMSETLDTVIEERKDEKKAIYTKLANHEGRIIKLETYRQ